MAPPKLYTWNESGNSYKVRLLAALLGIELDFIEIDFLGNQHHSPEFLAMNPRGQIPVLVDGERILTDSAAILVYLAGTHPGTSKTPSSFWSTDAIEQAVIVDWLAFAATWIHNGVSVARSILCFRGVSKENQQKLAEVTSRGHDSLEMLQKRLSENEWLALGRPTIADIAVFPYVALAPMGDILLDPYPAVKNWISRVRSLPGFIPIQGLDDPGYRKRL